MEIIHLPGTTGSVSIPEFPGRDLNGWRRNMAIGHSSSRKLLITLSSLQAQAGGSGDRTGNFPLEATIVIERAAWAGVTCGGPIPPASPPTCQSLLPPPTLIPLLRSPPACAPSQGGGMFQVSPPGAQLTRLRPLRPQVPRSG